MAQNKRGFWASGATILVSGAAAAPLGLLAANTNTNEMDRGVQARLHNAGPNLAFVAFGATAAAAQANAVIPTTSPGTNVIALPVGGVEVLTAGKGMYWSAICAGGQTAAVYVCPGDGI